MHTALFVRNTGSKRRGSSRLALAAAFAALVTGICAAPHTAYAQNSVRHTRYAVTDLGTLGGKVSHAYAVNDAGQVVGVAETASLTDHAFLFDKGTMRDLGTLPGGRKSEAYDINASGQVVGFSRDSDSSNDHAFLYSNGVMTDLGTLGGDESYAYGINNAGQIVGYSNTASGRFHAFSYKNGVMTDLGTLPGGNVSYAFGINSAGQIVGYSSVAGGDLHAFSYKNGVMTDLGTLTGLFSYAKAINDAGQIVGYSNAANGSLHSFLYKDGTMRDISAPNATSNSAYSINNTGQVVGTSNDEAFVYAASADGLLNLNAQTPFTFGVTAGAAEDVNASGQIVSNSPVYINGGIYDDTGSRQSHAFLFTPVVARWLPVDVAVNRTDNTSRLLWRERTGRYALWKVSATGAAQIGKYYGPITGYTCEEITVAPNGQTTLLWKNPTTKQVALWTIAADLSSIVKASVYPYPAGYAPSYLAADKDNNIRLTWGNTTSEFDTSSDREVIKTVVAFWTITPANGAITKSATYGPYQNLKDGPIAVGADGVIRFAWRNAVTGGATLWTIPSAYGAPTSGYNYAANNAFLGHLAVGADNKTRLQWSYLNGKIAEWKVNTANGAIENGKFYGPIAGVSPLGLSVGGDNQTRQLWTYTSGSAAGKAALWVLNDPLTSITTAYTYGPIP